MKKLLVVFRYLLSVHVTGLIILSFFRLILFLTNTQHIADADDKISLFLNAMLKGIQFDNLIGCYVIVLPLFVLSALALFNLISRISIKIFNVYFIVFYTLIFALSAADIPYFQYFFAHIGGSVFNWTGFGATTAGMLFQETSYYIYFALFVALVVAFSFVVRRFGKKALAQKSTNLKGKDYLIYIPLTIVVWGLSFCGVRGGFERYPLRVSNAYFSTNSFINQLGVNPAFFFIKSSTAFFKKHNTLDGIMDTKVAIATAQKLLNITDDEGYKNPIARAVVAEGEPVKANVVIVLMESLAVEDLATEYNGRNLMPFLNDLISRSYYFENFYSAGVHTNNGIASTLYGYPPQFDKTMMGVSVDQYTGLPVTLRDAGYQTLFFLTSNPQYDNMNSFLLENGFDRVYSQYDYPQEKAVNNFGVQDDFLFEYGIETLNTLSQQDEPFFATFMTVSNHPPYVIPKEFADAGGDDKQRIISFADHSMKEFMEDARRQSWFENTIFVFLGDHGRIQGAQRYDMSLTYNHVPLIIYSPLFQDMPKIFSQFGGRKRNTCTVVSDHHLGCIDDEFFYMPKIFSQFGGQVDVFATGMGMLNRSYENSSMGVDLFREERPYMYFVSDHHLGCIDDEFFYMYSPSAKADALYDYRNGRTENLIEGYRAKADSMKNYGVSMMLTSDYLVKEKLAINPK